MDCEQWEEVEELRRERVGVRESIEREQGSRKSQSIRDIKNQSQHHDRQEPIAHIHTVSVAIPSPLARECYRGQGLLVTYEMLNVKIDTKRRAIHPRGKIYNASYIANTNIKSTINFHPYLSNLNGGANVGVEGQGGYDSPKTS